MRLYRSLDAVPADFGPSALTIGNFDGVHTGHRRILRRVKQIAIERGWKPSALMFDPHPARVVAPQRAPRLMTPPERRASLMADEGIEQVLILPFTADVARLAPEEFARRIVAGRLGARAVLVGDNFRFGHDHAGNVEILRELGRRLGFETEIVAAVARRGRPVSSSAIRGLLESGSVALAARWLERPYALEGEVVAGRGAGSRQTVPTLNLAAGAELIPRTGVYVTRTRDLESARAWNSITNIGYRPTFGDSTQLTIETFLLDPPIGETPRRISVEFLWRVREERRFTNPEALKARILRDAAAARRYFVRAGRRTPSPPAPA
ncbi:MAG: riboflavin biosynthesis protein RibF [Bryobacteraceae bacterium]